MRASLTFALALLVLAPLSAGCGSESQAGPAGAEIAPASAELFISVQTDFDSEEWRQAVEVVERFPDGDRALGLVLEGLGLGELDPEADLEPALGPETDVVVFDLEGEAEAVGLTQPDDPAKLAEVFAELDEDMVTREIDGWTAFSDSDAALDRFEAERSEGSLADSDPYAETMGDLEPGLVHVFLSREAGAAPFPADLMPALGFTLGAEEDGVRLDGRSQFPDDESLFFSENFAAELPESVPAPVLAYAGASDLEATFSGARDLFAEAMPEFDRDLARVENEIGVSLEEDVFPLFRGETALYVRAGLFIPEVTLLTEVEDEAAALETVEQLFAAAGEFGIFDPPREGDVDGVNVVEMQIRGTPIALAYAAFDGRLVVTTSASGIAALRGDGDRLADDEDFRGALDDAGVPEETSGFAYVDLENLIPYVLGFAEQAGDAPPPEVSANLEPLQRLVVYSETDGSAIRFSGLLTVD